MPPQGYGFCRFGLKTGIDFAHFDLNSGMVFEASTTGVYEHIYQFQMSKREREICQFEIEF